MVLEETLAIEFRAIGLQASSIEEEWMVMHGSISDSLGNLDSFLVGELGLRINGRSSASRGNRGKRLGAEFGVPVALEIRSYEVGYVLLYDSLPGL